MPDGLNFPRDSFQSYYLSKGKLDNIQFKHYLIILVLFDLQSSLVVACYNPLAHFNNGSLTWDIKTRGREITTIARYSIELIAKSIAILSHISFSYLFWCSYHFSFLQHLQIKCNVPQKGQMTSQKLLKVLDYCQL